MVAGLGYHPLVRHQVFSRRQWLMFFGACAVPWARGVSAQTADLPLKTTGLEHFGMTVPDPEASARFYGRIFDPQLFQERDPPARYYVKLGTGYLAFGGNASVAPNIDHFCVLVPDLRPQEMRKSLEAAAVPMSAGPLGMATDPDGFRLQLLGVPGGLARTVVPAFRVSQDDALFQAVAPDHVMLHVQNLARSVDHYRKLFGPELASSKKTGKTDRVWFQVARTRLGLETVAPGEMPRVHHISVRIAGFERRAATAALKRMNVPMVPSDDENLLRFRDPNGLIMELQSQG
jgi:catechol 2,3-dioxygenase-like lactoylglutathione lyase family enzyme